MRGRKPGFKLSKPPVYTRGKGTEDCANCGGAGHILKVECTNCRGLGYRKIKKTKWVEI